MRSLEDIFRHSAGDPDDFKTTAKTGVGAVNELFDEIELINETIAESLMPLVPAEGMGLQLSLLLTRTVYIDGTLGNDMNDGLAAGAGAFKTITAAINSVPKQLMSNVTLVVAEGSYDEDVIIDGFTGKGVFYLNGGNSLVTAANYTVQSIQVKRCVSQVVVTGFDALKTTATAFLNDGSSTARFVYCSTSVTATDQSGFAVFNGKSRVENCSFSNRHKAIVASDNGEVFVFNISSGSGNTYGLYSINGGKIAKFGTMPQGSELAIQGGMIYNADGTIGGLVRGHQVLTSDITLYVRPDGNDANTGLTNDAAGALRTIQAAVDRLPKRLDSQVIINVSAGTYAETVRIVGFTGSSQLRIVGAASVATTHNVSNFYLSSNSNQINIEGFNITTTTDWAISAYMCVYVYVPNCQSTGAKASWGGIYASSSVVIVSGGIFSNSYYGFVSYYGSRVIGGSSVGGTGNTNGLHAGYSSMISMDNTCTLTGTNPRIMQYGGQIFSGGAWDGVGSKLCKASANAKHSQGNLTFNNTGSNILVGRFIPDASGSVRMSFTINQTGNKGALMMVAPTVGTNSAAVDNPGIISVGQNLITAAIGTTGVTVSGSVELISQASMPASATAYSFDISVTAGVPVLIVMSLGGTTSAGYFNGFTISYDYITAPTFG